MRTPAPQGTRGHSICGCRVIERGDDKALEEIWSTPCFIDCGPGSCRRHPSCQFFKVRHKKKCVRVPWQHQAVQRVCPNPGIKYAAEEENHKCEAHHADVGRRAP